MNSASPIWAAGWISTPVITRVALASRRGASGTPALVQRVGHAVGQQRLHAAVGQQDLRAADGARGGVALVRGGQVRAQLARDAREGAEAEHRQDCAAAGTRAQAGQSARRPVATSVWLHVVAVELEDAVEQRAAPRRSGA